MADLGTGRAGTGPVVRSDVSSNANATTRQRSPQIFTHIEAANMLSLRIKKPYAARWSERWYVLINPDGFPESVSVGYSRRTVLGLSHEVVQYINTGAREISMELWCNYHVLRQRNAGLSRDEALRSLLKYRNFFESMTVPSGARLAPPLVNVNWPRADLYFQGVVEDLAFEYTRFAYNGAPTEFRADIAFVEVGRGLMKQSSVQEFGWGVRTGSLDWTNL